MIKTDADSMTLRPTADATPTHPEAAAMIASWWRLESDEAADEAARAALEAMPWSEGLLRFCVLRSPGTPDLFLQSLWTTTAARDHYVGAVAAAPRSVVDQRAPGIHRERRLAAIEYRMRWSAAVADQWVVRRLQASDPDEARTLAATTARRMRAERPAELLGGTIGIGETEVVVIEERTGSVSSAETAYRVVGAVEPGH